MAQGEILRLKFVEVSKKLVLRVEPTRMHKIVHIESYKDKNLICKIFNETFSYELNIGCVRNGLCLTSPEGIKF